MDLGSIPVDITPRAGRALLLRLDPAVWFDSVPFDQLEASGGRYEFPDAPEGAPVIALFNGLKSIAGYELSVR